MSSVRLFLAGLFFLLAAAVYAEDSVIPQGRLVVLAEQGKDSNKTVYVRVIEHTGAGGYGTLVFQPSPSLVIREFKDGVYYFRTQGTELRLDGEGDWFIGELPAYLILNNGRVTGVTALNQTLSVTFDSVIADTRAPGSKLSHLPDRVYGETVDLLIQCLDETGCAHFEYDISQYKKHEIQSYKTSAVLSFTLTNTGKKSNTYFIRYRAVDLAGNTGPWRDIYYRIDPNLPDILISRVSGLPYNPDSISISWTSDKAVAYGIHSEDGCRDNTRLSTGKGEAPSKVFVDEKLDISGLTEPEFNLYLCATSENEKQDVVAIPINRSTLILNDYPFLTFSGSLLQSLGQYQNVIPNGYYTTAGFGWGIDPVFNNLFKQTGGRRYYPVPRLNVAYYEFTGELASVSAVNPALYLDWKLVRWKLLLPGNLWLRTNTGVSFLQLSDEAGSSRTTSFTFGLQSGIGLRFRRILLLAGFGWQRIVNPSQPLDTIGPVVEVQYGLF